MAHKDNASYKIKLLILYEILRRETDETHMLSTKELIEKLAERGISCDRKILYDDIKTLNDNGYEVFTERGQQMNYYVPEPAFDDYELRILLDAVQAAKFITPQKTKELEQKITSLAGANKEDFAQKNITCLNTKKSFNKNIFINVSNITDAIQNKKKISFIYFDVGVGGERRLRNNGAVYVENPIDLMINEDNYYLLAYNEAKDIIKTYRVDRMDKVNELDAPAVRKRINDAQQIRTTSFSMFAGDSETVELKFDKSISSLIVDRFGIAGTAGVRVLEDTDEYSVISCNVGVSNTFYAWCFTFGDKLQILSPKAVVDGYKEMLEKTLNSMNK